MAQGLSWSLKMATLYTHTKPFGYVYAHYVRVHVLTAMFRLCSSPLCMAWMVICSYKSQNYDYKSMICCSYVSHREQTLTEISIASAGAVHIHGMYGAVNSRHSTRFHQFKDQPVLDFISESKR